MTVEKVNHYLVIVYGDIEPEIFPFETTMERDNAAIKHKHINGDDDGIFKLDVVNGIPEMTTYSNKFFWDALGEWVD
jgi:hypothetical protein